MSGQSIHFTTTLLTAKKNATGICVPNEVMTALGGGRRLPVKVTINAHTYDSTIAVMDGVFMVPVSAAVRGAAGIKGGDEIDVMLTPDTAAREVELPEDFQRALDEYTAAKEFFETLSNSQKKRYIIPIEQAKTPETKNKRIEKAIGELMLQKKV